MRKKGWTWKQLEEAHVVGIDENEGFLWYNWHRLERLGFDVGKSRAERDLFNNGMLPYAYRDTKLKIPASPGLGA